MSHVLNLAAGSTEGLTTTKEVLAVIHAARSTPDTSTSLSELAERVAELVVDRLAERGLQLSPRMPVAAPSAGWISVAEVARRLDRHPDTVREDLRAGRLPGVKVGRSWRVKVSDIDHHLLAAGDAERLQRAEEARSRAANAAARERARARRAGR